MNKFMVVGFAAVLAFLSQRVDAQENTNTQSPVKQQDIDRLKRQIQQDTQSSAEVITEFHTESGDLNNRLDIFRYGGRLNLKMGSSSLFQFTGTRTNYRPIESVFNQDSINATAGIHSRIAEAVESQFEIGATRFSNDTSSINGLAAITYSHSDAARIYGVASRNNVEETLLSATGVRPIVGPFAGQLVGQVMENRFVGGASAPLVAGFDVFGEGGVGTRTGTNVPSNFFKTITGGAGYNIIARADDSPLTLLRTMYELNYFGFNENRSGFGGGSLLTRTGLRIAPNRIGSDLLPIVPGDSSAGTGGYFSPRNFVTNTARVEAKGGSADRLSYAVTGFIGSQDYTDARSRWATGFSGTVNVGISERFYVPVTYAIDNFGPFTQQSLFARLGVRF